MRQVYPAIRVKTVACCPVSRNRHAVQATVGHGSVAGSGRHYSPASTHFASSMSYQDDVTFFLYIFFDISFSMIIFTSGFFMIYFLCIHPILYIHMNYMTEFFKTRDIDLWLAQLTFIYTLFTIPHYIVGNLQLQQIRHIHIYILGLRR